MGEYPIYMNQNVVGKAQVEQEGLYYRVRCTCDVSANSTYRICADSEAGIFNVGICTPKGNQLIADKRVAIKYISADDLSFHAISDDKIKRIICEQPFSELSKLQAGRMIEIGAEVGILFTDQFPGPPDNDPIP